ncbi:MAG: CPBP family intramembrane metalloprotease [Bacteroidetes bacterium]|nr:CPBP family intramembrane metalloprotease [Bacteroidota bacterium]
MNDDYGNNQNLDDAGQPEPENPEQLEPTMSPVKAALYGLILVFLLYQVGGSLLTLAIFGLDFENADINAVRLLTMCGQILLILAPALMLAKLVYENVSAVIRFKLPSLKEIAVFSAGMFILIPLMQNFLYIQNYLIHHLALHYESVASVKFVMDNLYKLITKTYLELLTATNAVELILIVFVVAIVPSICEEVFFRGFIQKSFELKSQPFIAAFITAAFFGLYHFNPYGLIALIILGTYFGFAAYMSNSIAVPIFLHFLNNAVAIAAFYFYGSDDFLETNIIEIEHVGEQFISFLILSSVFAIFIVFITNNYSRISSRRNTV